LEFKLFFAALDRANYQTVIDPATGAETWGLVYPTELRLEVQSWQTDSANARICSCRTSANGGFRGGQPLSEDEAAYLFNLLQQCDAGAQGDDEDAKSRCRFAAAGTIVTMGGAWLPEP
jgi:hypothetical protein